MGVNVLSTALDISGQTNEDENEVGTKKEQTSTLTNERNKGKKRKGCVHDVVEMADDHEGEYIYLYLQ